MEKPECGRTFTAKSEDLAWFSQIERFARADGDARPGDLTAHLDSLDGAGLVALAQSLRNQAWKVGLGWARLDRQQADRLLGWTTATGAAALLSMHRDGFVREAAVRRLALDESGLATRALLLRLDDTVEGNRALASGALERRMTAVNARVFAQMAPALDALGRRARAGSGGALAGLAAYLASAACRDAMIEATRSPEAPVRLASLRRLMPGASPELRGALLAHALDDPSVAVARWAVGELTSHRSPAPVQRALLPRLEAHRSAELRRRAAAARGRLGDVDALRDAMLDRSGDVRHEARERCAALGQPFDTRELCLAALEGEPSRRRLLGAIAALGDAGLQGDLARLAALARSSDAVVRAEAVRAVGLLGGDVEAALGDPSARVRREARRARGER